MDWLGFSPSLGKRPRSPLGSSQLEAAERALQGFEGDADLDNMRTQKRYLTEVIAVAIA